MDACHTGLGGVCGGGLGVLQCGGFNIHYAVFSLFVRCEDSDPFFSCLVVCVRCLFAKQVGTEKYAHRERTAAELYGSAVGAGGKFVGGGEYTLENYIVPVGDGRRDFFSTD